MTIQNTISLFLLLLIHLAFGQWVKTQDLHAGCVRSLLLHGSFLFAGTDSGGVYISGNSGASWLSAGSGLTKKSVSALAANGGIVFAGTNGGGVFVSKDGGSTWERAQNGLTDTLIRALAVTRGSVFAATSGGYTASGPVTGYRGGVFCSRDNGGSWAPVMYTDLYMVTCLSTSDSCIAAGTNGGGVFLSTDCGQTWAECNAWLPSFLVQVVSFWGKNLFAVTYDPACDDGSAFRTTIASPRWTFANDGLLNPEVHCLCAVDSTLFAATDGGGVFRTSNGETWTSLNDGLNDLSVLSLAASDSFLFCGTGTGSVWQYRRSEIAMLDVPFHQNSPRQGRIRITSSGPRHYSLDVCGNVSCSGPAELDIYTACGKRAAVLTRPAMAAGETGVRFDIGFLSSGLYAYRFFSGSHCSAGRFLLK
jgi:photosystem II stability/assembly factor-like uncharacterized protein